MPQAAHAAGLVTQVVAHEDLIPAALAVGAQVSRSHALAARTLLASYRRADRAIRDAGYDVESRTAESWNVSVPSTHSTAYVKESPS